MVRLSSVPAVLLILLPVLSCAGVDEPSPNGADPAAGDYDPPHALAAPLSWPCRPEYSPPWEPGIPLRLPCAPTREPCDGIDNDLDGITDPHCDTIACRSDADCTVGGLVPDADCNQNLPTGSVCNQIDGAPFTEKNLLCRGMLCPPGLKCYVGDCIVPGSRPPDSPCTSGAQCAINAGCIPVAYGDPASAVCVQFCHELPCPAGFTCEDHSQIAADGKLVQHRVCEAVDGERMLAPP